MPVLMVAAKGTTPLGAEMHETAGVGVAAGTHDVDIDVAAGRTGSAHRGCTDDCFEPDNAESVFEGEGVLLDSGILIGLGK